MEKEKEIELLLKRIEDSKTRIGLEQMSIDAANERLNKLGYVEPQKKSS